MGESKVKKSKIKKDKIKIWPYFLVAFLFLLIGFAFGHFIASKNFEISGFLIYNVSTQGYTEVSITLEPGIIYLTSDCKQLNMTTTPEQIQIIQSALDKKLLPRPTSHDLMALTTENFNITVLIVKIEDLKDCTYYAKLFLQKQNKVLALDSRPSDAIAIALKSGAKIYVKNELLDSASNIC